MKIDRTAERLREVPLRFAAKGGLNKYSLLILA
jgi:hypothetical protein